MGNEGGVFLPNNLSLFFIKMQIFFIQIFEKKMKKCVSKIHSSPGALKMPYLSRTFSFKGTYVEFTRNFTSSRYINVNLAFIYYN